MAAHLPLSGDPRYNGGNGVCAGAWRGLRRRQMATAESMAESMRSRIYGELEAWQQTFVGGEARRERETGYTASDSGPARNRDYDG